MATIVTRAGKGSPLTNTELDSNFTNLNTDKVEVDGALGTPSSGTATNLTGTAAGLTAGNVTTNANLTGVVTSTGNATAIADAALSIAKSSGLQTALDSKQAVSGKDVASGYAGLDGAGKINPSQLPALAITDTFVVATQVAMLALTAEVGDIAVRTDLNKSYILRVTGASTLANWQELLTPTDAVSSVFGRSGVVTAQNGDYTAAQVGLGNVDNTSDATKNAAAVTLTNKTLVTPALGTPSALVVTNASGTASININGTVGATTPSTGAFTTISASGEITANGGIALGDNDKATFGDGDDLQIYHDGSNSYIKENGTGQLIVNATNLYLRNSANTQDYLTAVESGATKLLYADSIKIATTATGIDVTGDVVNSGNLYSTVNNSLKIISGGNASNAGSNLTLYGGTNASAGTFRFRNGTATYLEVDGNGDVSFYEDTGTSPKFVWDNGLVLAMRHLQQPLMSLAQPRFLQT
jgi:hypothetical protein